MLRWPAPFWVVFLPASRPRCSYFPVFIPCCFVTRTGVAPKVTAQRTATASRMQGSGTTPLGTALMGRGTPARAGRTAVSGAQFRISTASRRGSPNVNEASGTHESTPTRKAAPVKRRNKGWVVVVVIVIIAAGTGTAALLHSKGREPSLAL